MKLHLLNRKSEADRSFKIATHRFNHFLKVWHYHPELELVLIEKSTGTRFVGDNIQKFQEGEVVLLGKNLPHMWLNDEKYFDASNTSNAEAISIHFSEGFLGPEFFLQPEMKSIHNLLCKAQRGLVFRNLPSGLKNIIRDLIKLEAFERTHSFLKILQDLGNISESELLASENFIRSFSQIENSRLIKVYEYVFANFQNKIELKDLALICNMKSSSFSRFFKRMHHKTFTRYLNELRIGYACKLLMENDQNISAICYESGFNNLSNFNRQFKLIKGLSPREFKYQLTQSS